MNNNPWPLSPKEWDEVASVDLVRDSWGLEPQDHGAELSEVVYAVKFTFISGSPGYVGDLFVLTGDSLSAPPVVLVRAPNGALEVADF